MPEEKTDVAGAEPVNTTGKAGAEPVAKPDAKAESSTEGEPWHKDPRFKNDLGLLKTAKSLMEKNELDSVEDLVELFESGKKVKGKQVDLDKLDEIADKAAKLDKYEAYWRDQEERRKRGDEDPQETIARLDKELKAKNAAERQKEYQMAQAEQAKKAISSFERDVTDLVREMEIPKDQASFVREFFGVGNPVNDIDITDRKAIRKLVAEGIKKKEAYDQAVIAAYLKTKDSIPKVTSGAGATTETTKPKIMLKDARKIFLETMQKASGG